MADPSVRPPLPVRWLLALPPGRALLARAVCRKLTRPPRRRSAETPDAYGWDWHPIRLRAADGVRLRGWCLEPHRPAGTVALFHGLKGNRESVLGRSAVLAAAGYRCVAVDHRAHGDSGGRHSSFGWHERHDVAAVCEHVRSRWPGFRAALGMSMGAAALCYAAGTVGWHAVVLESVYDDVLSVFARRVATGYYPAWFGGMLGLGRPVVERRLGVSLDDLRTADRLRDLAGTPTLFVTGDRDETVPAPAARAVAAAHPGPSSLWVVPGAGHRDVFEVGGDEYRRRVLGHLDQARAASSGRGRSAA